MFFLLYARTSRRKTHRSGPFHVYPLVTADRPTRFCFLRAPTDDGGRSHQEVCCAVLSEKGGGWWWWVAKHQTKPNQTKPNMIPGVYGLLSAGEIYSYEDTKHLARYMNYGQLITFKE